MAIVQCQSNISNMCVFTVNVCYLQAGYRKVGLGCGGRDLPADRIIGHFEMPRAPSQKINTTSLGTLAYIY